MSDRFPDQPLQWLQLHEHDNVKASYDNLKMRNAFRKNTF